MRGDDSSTEEGLMNQSLFVMDLLAAMFFPAGFMAGAFGMNFTDMQSGVSNVKQGFLYFWILCCIAMVACPGLVLLILRYFGNEQNLMAMFWATVGMGLLMMTFLASYSMFEQIEPHLKLHRGLLDGVDYLG